VKPISSVREKRNRTGSATKGNTAAEKLKQSYQGLLKGEEKTPAYGERGGKRQRKGPTIFSRRGPMYWSKEKRSTK